MKNSIFDFFTIDLFSIPDQSYLLAEQTTNAASEPLDVYRKNLEYKECGLFDNIEIFVINHTSKNIFFRNFDTLNVNFKLIENLINDLFLIYGLDSSNKGKFNTSDINDFNSGELSILFGRNWTDYPKFKYPISIGREENFFQLTIWGVEHQP